MFAFSIDVQSLLKAHQEKVLPPIDFLGDLDGKVDSIDVRRSRVWHDVLSAMTRSSFSGQKWLRVNFVLEEAVDDGGPRREFFRLAIQECSRSDLFAGPMHSRIVVQTVPAIEQKKYRVAGIGACTHFCVVRFL